MTHWGFLSELLWVLLWAGLIAVIVWLFRKQIGELLRRLKRVGQFDFYQPDLVVSRFEELPGAAEKITPPLEPTADEEIVPAESRLDHMVDRKVTAGSDQCADIYWLGYNLVAAGLTIMGGARNNEASQLLQDAQHHLHRLRFSDQSYEKRLATLRARFEKTPAAEFEQPAVRYGYWKQLEILRDELGAHFELYQRRIPG